MKNIFFIIFLFLLSLSDIVFAEAISQNCNTSINNFSYELNQSFSQTVKTSSRWGSHNPIYKLNPNLKKCENELGISWQQARVMAATDFWIHKKLNYCHHHSPYWQTPTDLRDAEKSKGGYCSPKPNTQNQKIRWNFSGSDKETSEAWQNESMWFGLDCSNFTAFIYNFSLGIKFSSHIQYQAGQRAKNIYLTPNQQTMENILDNPKAAGKLVCMDNTVEMNHSCENHGGYISVFNNNGKKISERITESVLEKLQPGDLIFIAPSKNNLSIVRHVVLWTGKKIGPQKNQINSNEIAPNPICPESLHPKEGDWVIADSHYQGLDYRALTNCYYRNNIWGVRRAWDN